jgi:hypothetical protein
MKKKTKNEGTTTGEADETGEHSRLDRRRLWAT